MTKMASFAEQNFHMLPHQMGQDMEDQDFALFPDAHNIYDPNSTLSRLQCMESEQIVPYLFPKQDEPYASTMSFSSNAMFGETQPFLGSPDARGPAPSNYSTTSATSSTIGSPHSIHGQMGSVPEWSSNTFGLAPTIVGYDNCFSQGSEYSFNAPGLEDLALDFATAKPNSFVDPSILHPGYPSHTLPANQVPTNEQAIYPSTYPASPSLSQLSHSPKLIKAGSQSPYTHTQFAAQSYMTARRPSLVSHRSPSSQDNFSSDESREKGRCTYPECGKVFKDLRAHMLTHQTERPEKCPIQTCDYHIKGFARKYDKNRHTLTHYKGTMVCGFCPGSGSAAEKSFNRADVFKRHLTSVHAVEQTPPNSRKKTSSNVNSTKKLTGCGSDVTGKCSTCSATFHNAQDFYEHFDDCVLRIVQQEDPAEAINARRLAEVESDPAVHETLRSNALPVTTSSFCSNGEEEDEDSEEDGDDEFSSRSKLQRKKRGNRNPLNGVQKFRGLTHSKGGVTLHSKGRKRRKNYPSSWGCASTQMKLKKRVMCVFDGPRRLWKDDMMLDTDYEIRLKLENEKAYVTDLDVQTMMRAEGFHGATEEEKGPWICDDLTGIDLEKLMEVKCE